MKISDLAIFSGKYKYLYAFIEPFEFIRAAEDINYLLNIDQYGIKDYDNQMNEDY